jgi:hypothetical protein
MSYGYLDYNIVIIQLKPSLIRSFA